MFLHLQVVVRQGALSCKKTRSFLGTLGTMMTPKLISVVNLVLVPLDEVY